MKKSVFLLMLFLVSTVVLAQSLNDGMYSEEWQRPRDSIANTKPHGANAESIKWLNGYYDNYIMSPPDPQLMQKVSNAVKQAPRGVRFENSSYSQTHPSSNHVSYQQSQQIKKAQRDAEHRAWIEQRRLQQEQIRRQKEWEEQRKKEERQRRYVQGRDRELQNSAEHYQQQHNQISYNVTEGYERTMSYQPAGTEKLMSQYIPSSTASTYDISSVIAKNGNKMTKLNRNEHVKSSSKWDNRLDSIYTKNNISEYINASTNLTKKYVMNPQDITQLLHDEFKNVSGFDLDAIMQKLPFERTEAEKQALMDYQEYRRRMLHQMASDINGIVDNTEEKKLIDAAILADNVYDPYRKESYHTNYKRKVFFSEDDPLRGVAEAIHLIGNRSGGETGFHAEIYYNKQNDTYMISIEGSGSKDTKDWVNNNLPNLLNNEVIPQYDLALDIAKAINNIPETERTKLNIEIVGHSLGGGVASVIGLATGLETKTFNAARVPASFLEKHGLNGRNANNITAYHTSTDILTTLQQAAGTPAIGKSVDIGDPSTLLEKGKAMVNGALMGTTITNFVSVPGDVGVGAAGGALLGEKVEGHRMPPIVRSIMSENTKKAKAEWDRLHHIQLELVKAANSPELQTQETILIR